MSPAAIEAIVILAAKYGPELVTGIIGLFKTANPTIADVEAVFASVKPYSAYNIPETVPVIHAALPIS